RHDLAALNDLANLLDDVGVGQRGDVAGIHVIGDGGQDAAHNLAGARFGHVRNDMDALGPRDFANHGFDGGGNLLNDLLFRKNAGLERDVDFGDAALHLVHDRNDGGFRDFGDGEAGGLEFLGAEAVAGDVDDVVHAAENAVVAVGRKDGGVGGVVGPIAPILALRILVVFLVVLFDEAVWIAPDGLHDAGPGVANADVASSMVRGSDFLAFFIPDDGIDAEAGRTCAAGFHRVKRGLGGTQETAGFRLPPGVHDDGFALAHHFVIPAPDFRLDRLTDSGHVLKAVVVFFGLLGARFAKHANGSG